MRKFSKSRIRILLSVFALLILALASYAAQSPQLQMNAPVTLPADI